MYGPPISGGFHLTYGEPNQVRNGQQTSQTLTLELEPVAVALSTGAPSNVEARNPRPSDASETSLAGSTVDSKKLEYGFRDI